MIWFLAFCSLLGFSWKPLFFALPVLLIAATITIVQCLRAAFRASFPPLRKGIFTVALLRLVTAWLHLIQPLARLWGRLEYGLTVWRPRGTGAIEGMKSRLIFPFNSVSHLMSNGPQGFPSLLPTNNALWTKNWVAPEERVREIWQNLRSEGAISLSGDEFSRWDLEVRSGMFGAARLLLAIEDHGGGAQYVRTRIWPRVLIGARFALVAFGLLAFGAAWDNAWVATVTCGAIFLVFLLWTLRQSGRAVATLHRATSHLRSEATHC